MKSLTRKTFDLSAERPLYNMHNSQQPTLPEKKLVTLRSGSHRNARLKLILGKRTIPRTHGEPDLGCRLTLTFLVDHIFLIQRVDRGNIKRVR